MAVIKVPVFVRSATGRMTRRQHLERSLAAIVNDGGLELAGGDLIMPEPFLLGRREGLLPQAGGAELAAVRLIFTEFEAREVGVGEAMLARYLSEERQAGIALFDAHVAPGHRLAKNFFESAGFSARRIVMNRDEPGAG